MVTEYDEEDLENMFEFMNNLKFHLTASVISNNVRFTNHIVKNTVNGLTTVGMRGRTTGSPQNHWFGPSNDPRGTGCGSREGILQTWTCHREIVNDYGAYDTETKPGIQS